MLNYQVLKNQSLKNDKGYQQACSSCKRELSVRTAPSATTPITSQGPELKSEQQQGLADGGGGVK